MANRRTAIDDILNEYVVAQGVREHPAQTALREATRSQPHAGMQIGPDQGQFLAMLARVGGFRRAIEIGVFTGYSALSVALAMPDDGYLLACDVSEDYTRVGRPFWDQAGVAHKIDLRIAPAVETLDAQLGAGAGGSFDFAFIDADKSGYDAYYERCLRLVRPGGLIAIDNVLWGGSVVRAAEDADTRALQALNDKIHADERVDIVLVPIGDGVTLARRR
jgi:predicted O-methyltransferase YrrM